MAAPSRILFVQASLGLSSATERLRTAVASLVARGVEVHVLADAGARADEVQAAGAVLHLEAPLARGLRAPFAIARARRLAARLEVELVHVIGAGLAPLAARLGRSHLLELAGPTLSKLPWSHPHLRGVILPCRTLEEGAVNRGGLPRERMRLLPHLVATPTPARSAFSSGDPPRVGCAGALTAEFGADLLLEAGRALLGRGIGLHLFLFGEGPEESTLRRRARELAIEEEVSITAPSGPALERLLAELDVYVCPRRGGTPGWLTHQALALGRPSILSATQGAFELVEDGLDGRIVERGDAPRLAEALEDLLDDPERATALGADARARHRARILREGEYTELLAQAYSEALVA